MALGIRHGPRRATPGASDIRLNGYTFRLGRADKNAELLIEQAPDQSHVIPSDYGYGADDPIDEATFEWKNFSGGMGLRRMNSLSSDFDKHRYSHTLNIDCSPGHPVKGPAIRFTTPPTRDTVNGINRAFEINGKVFALNGRYVHRRDGAGNVALEKDFGSGKTAKDVAVMVDNSGATTEYAYIAMGGASTDDFIWRFDGTTWTQDNILRAESLIAYAGKLFLADDTNRLRTPINLTDDVWADATTFTTYTVGTKSSKIVRLAGAANGWLLIYKTDGVYALANGSISEVFPQLRIGPSTTNGYTQGFYLSSNYVVYDGGLLKITPSGEGLGLGVEPAGLELLKESAPEAPHGPITAFAGHGAMHAYAGTLDGALLKLVPEVTQEVVSTGGDAQRPPEVWHGNIATTFANSAYITAMLKSAVGATANHEMLYLFFSDGTWGEFQLPNTFNPQQDSGYGFSTDAGYLYLPAWQSIFSSELSRLHGVTVVSQNLASGTASLAFGYDTTISGSPSYASSLSAAFSTSPRQRIDFPGGTNGTVVYPRLAFTGFTTTTPVLLSVALHYSMWRTPTRKKYKILVLADDNTIRADGVRVRRGVKRQIALLYAAKDDNQTITGTLPNREKHTLRIQDIGEAVAWDDLSQTWIDAVSLLVKDEGLIQIYGTHARMEALGSHTALQAFTHHQLETL